MYTYVNYLNCVLVKYFICRNKIGLSSMIKPKSKIDCMKLIYLKSLNFAFSLSSL